MFSFVRRRPLDSRARARDSAPRLGTFVETGSGRLHYLDWGGRGETVVLLAGLGNTAHVFDDFAPLLTDRFHVIGLTRRGFGASDCPGRTYDADTLAVDVRGALDALAPGRVHLVGHSYAGDEITRFAARYPERLGRVVYLDAAYDRAEIRRQLALGSFAATRPPTPPKLGRKDLASVAAYQAYLQRVHGVRWPEAEVRAFFAQPAEASLKLMLAARPPDYRTVRAPALAVFAVQQTVREAYPWLRESPEAGSWLTSRRKPFVEEQRDKFAREAPQGEIAEIRAPHYLFLSHRHEVARLVREFLA